MDRGRGNLYLPQLDLRRCSQTTMKNRWHRFMHWLGLTAGYVDHERDANGIWWIGLRCPKCGKLMSPVRSHYQD